MITDIEVMIKTAKIYSERNIPVHITKKNKHWLNGFIREVNEDFLIL